MAGKAAVNWTINSVSYFAIDIEMKLKSNHHQRKVKAMVILLEGANFEKLEVPYFFTAIFLLH